MKDNIFNSIKLIYYFVLIILFIIYLFPGSLIGYLLYGDFGKQPDLIDNPIGTSINHFIYFFILAFLGFINSYKEKKFINSLTFFLYLSFLLEISHFFIPNRAFEINDLIANNSGVLFAYFLLKIIKYK
jgi:VanZ family protein